MSQPAGRVLCPRCGANNFDSVAVCWKCSAPLKAPPRQPPVQPGPGTPEPGSALPAEPAAVRPVAAAVPATYARTANRAALWLGLLMPYFGFPIGLAFMMCDDPRRQEAGRVCLIWSAISTAVHFVLLTVTLLGMRELLAALLGAGRGLTQPPSGY